MLPQGNVFAGGDIGRRLGYTVTIDLMLPEPAYRLVPNAGLCSRAWQQASLPVPHRRSENS